MISVQVKTGTTSVFRLSSKDEQVGPATAQWYVLVRLGGVGSRPDFYVVPALVIAALVYVDHRRWLEEPSSRTGEPRKDTAIRACKSTEIASHQEQWELLHADPKNAPVHLPARAHTLGNGRIGWPPDHPGFPPIPAEYRGWAERPMREGSVLLPPWEEDSRSRAGALLLSIQQEAVAAGAGPECFCSSVAVAHPALVSAAASASKR